jgi:ferritin-like metal-binding protein YciE
VEHYEMAGYGTARAHARQLGFLHHAELLQQTLDEEAAANEKLTLIAESFINWRAEDKSGNGRQITKETA